jgi:hypothetical protein
METEPMSDLSLTFSEVGALTFCSSITTMAMNPEQTQKLDLVASCSYETDSKGKAALVVAFAQGCY